MKKIITIAALISFFSVSQTFAHGPSDIAAKFDRDSNTVAIKILHNISTSKIKDPAKHYINKVKIRLNKKQVEQLNYKKQDNPESLEISYKFKEALKKGDKITIQASCNILGSKDITITAE